MLRWLQAKEEQAKDFIGALFRFPPASGEKTRDIPSEPLSQAEKPDSSADPSDEVMAFFRDPSRLSGICDHLKQSIQGSETRFLELGEGLQSLNSDANGLGELTRQAIHVVGGDSDQGLLSHISAMARGALEQLTACHDQIRRNLEQVESGASSLEKLVAICGAIEKTGLSLNVVSVNFAVESSRSAESSQMFSVFVKEIRQLADKIVDIARSIIDDSHRTRVHQLSAHRQIGRNLGELKSLNQQAEKAVQQTIGKIQEIMGSSLEAMERVGNYSQAIARQVSEIVVAIQFQDITRQQIEHIVSALDDAMALCEKGAQTDPASQDFRLIAGQVHTIIRLQSAQLQEVVKEIQEAREQSEKAFAHLGRQVEWLMEDISALRVGQRDDDRIEEAFLSLKSDIEQLNTLLDQGYFMEQQIRQISERVSHTASQLSRHIEQVRHISIDLHLKALNAIVKTEHLGDQGLALEVLAQEVNQIARQSDQEVEKVVAVLEAIVSVSTRLEHSFEESEHHGPSLETGGEAIEQSYARFKSDTAEAMKRSRALRNAITHTEKELAFMPDLCQRLQRDLAWLEELARPLDLCSRQELEAAGYEFEELIRRYTMDRERDLHARAIIPADMQNGVTLFEEQSDSDSQSHPSAPSDGAEEGELGDNVELF